MIGIGLGILWVGYTALATGRAYAKGIPVTFSDMVLPKYRAATIAMLKQGGAGTDTTGATLGVPGASGQTPLGPVSPVTQLQGAGLAGSVVGGGFGVAGTALKAVGNGLSRTLNDITGGLL